MYMNKRLNMLLLVVLTVLTLFPKETITDDYEYKLINDLLQGYNLFARPSLRYEEPTNVTFGLSLSQLIDVDEKNQIITTNCWLTMAWVDHKLKWNTSEYGGIREIRLPYDRIWKPDVILYNNADTLASLSQISTQMVIESSGNVTWLSTSIFKSSCSINVDHFPFDEQNCSLSFASWTYDGNGINLLKNSDTGDISNYIPNGEWNLEKLLVERNIKIYSCCPVPYPNVTYYIVIKRRPLFYVFNMILPSILITIVGFLAFLIPPDSGEKVSMGVTTLLSMTVFLMVVAENMPPNSDSVPLIASYYFGSMLIISLATASTVLTLNTYKKGDDGEPVPEWLQRVFFDVIARILFMRVKVNRPISQSSTNFRRRFSSLLFWQERNNKFNQHTTKKCVVKMTTSCPKAPQVKSHTEKRFIASSKGASLVLKDSSRSIYLLENAYPCPNESSKIESDIGTGAGKPSLILRAFDSQTTPTVSGTESTSLPSSGSSSLSSMGEKKLVRQMRELSTRLDAFERSRLAQEKRAEMKNQWTELARIIDALLGYAFALTSTGLLAYLVWKTPNFRFY